jgi:chromosome segregation ATPase
MLQVLDRADHETRLRDLMSRFQNQERFMSEALQDLQNRLEHWHREASFQQLGDAPSQARSLLAHCSDLQSEYDELATELVHVRMAISGAGEELAHRDLAHRDLAHRDTAHRDTAERLGA